MEKWAHALSLILNSKIRIWDEGVIYLFFDRDGRWLIAVGHNNANPKIIFAKITWPTE